MSKPDHDAIDAALREPYQKRVNDWLHACFTPEICADKIERNHRFIEEALELVQACGCTQSEAHQLVDYVYGRPVGEIGQEIGGVMNTLAALCLAHGFDLDTESERELARVWTKIDKIRAKQAAKPKHSPLPEAIVPAGESAAGAARDMREAAAKLAGVGCGCADETEAADCTHMRGHCRRLQDNIEGVLIAAAKERDDLRALLVRAGEAMEPLACDCYSKGPCKNSADGFGGFHFFADDQCEKFNVREVLSAIRTATQQETK